MLFIKPFSTLFFIIYILCGAGDILDGYLARKMNLVSKSGQILDSVADLFMTAVVLFVFLSHLKLYLWIILWIAVIAFIRILSLFIGSGRYKQPAFLHTYANKFTGLLLFFFPFIYICWGLSISSILICTVATLSATEELFINLFSKTLNRDIKSIFGL